MRTLNPDRLDGYKYIDYNKFKKLYNEGQFEDGPWMESFGDGYGDPYCPDRNCWGTLKNGKRVKSNSGDR